MSKHMTKDEARKEIYRLLDTMDVGSPGFEAISESAFTLRNSARRLQWLGERECNGVTGPDGFAKWDEGDQAKNDSDREKAENRAAKAIEAIMDSEARQRIEIEFQGDPRGAPILIHEKNGRQRIAVFW